MFVYLDIRLPAAVAKRADRFGEGHGGKLDPRRWVDITAAVVREAWAGPAATGARSVGLRVDLRQRNDI